MPRVSRPRGGLTSSASPRTVGRVAGSTDKTAAPISGDLPRHRAAGARRIDLIARRGTLPAQFGQAIDDFERHLRLERNRSVHTVRGYIADAVSLLDHAVRGGRTSLTEIDLGVLRSWLAEQRTG